MSKDSIERLEQHCTECMNRHRFILLQAETNPDIDIEYHSGAVDAYEDILLFIDYEEDSETL